MRAQSGFRPLPNGVLTLLTGIIAMNMGCTSREPQDGLVDGGQGNARRLRQVKTAVVASGLGPSIVAAGDRLFVGYGRIDQDGVAQRLAVVSPELEVTDDFQAYVATSTELPGATKLNSADIRLARGDGCTFWYAYEVVDLSGSQSQAPAYAFAVEYDICGATPTVTVKSSSPIATSVEGPMAELGPNVELVNDPTPFVHNGARYVVTRRWLQRAYTVYRLNDGLDVDSSWSLSLEGVLESDSAHQNALIGNGAGVWLLQQASSGPAGPGASSNIAAVSLSDDLTQGFVATSLSSCPDYESYSVGAREEAGLLFWGYQIPTGTEPRPGYPGFAPRLKVSDTTNGFKLVDAVALADDGTAGERVTMDVLDDAIYVAFLTPGDYGIHVAKFVWEEAPDGGMPLECP